MSHFRTLLTRTKVLTQEPKNSRQMSFVIRSIYLCTTSSIFKIHVKSDRKCDRTRLDLA
jgi:hypothetical protein